jgi:hypothetical protein
MAIHLTAISSRGGVTWKGNPTTRRMDVREPPTALLRLPSAHRRGFFTEGFYLVAL